MSPTRAGRFSRSQKRNTSNESDRHSFAPGDASDAHRIDGSPQFRKAERSLEPSALAPSPNPKESCMRHRTLVLTIIAVMALAIPAVAVARPLIVGGSTSVLPLAEKLAAAYHNAFPSIPKPKVKGGQSDIGISGVHEGRFDIGDSSRDPIKNVDPKGLTFVRIARDGICIITNPKNPMANLSEESVKAIFTGRYNDWSQVPGHKITGPIDLFDRDGASGTQDAFKHIFLSETENPSSHAQEKTSNGLERNAVEHDTQGVGFVSFAYTAGVNAVAYNGVACNLRNARSEQYLGVRNFWMVTNGKPKGAALKFLSWVTSGKALVNRIINSSWISVY
jgi:phosphate transport system substrate-binding protein